MRRVLLIAPLWLLVSGCDELVYPCQSDRNCVILGVQGACLPAGAGTSYCAFSDGKCPSGYRWDASAPASIQNNCVSGVPNLHPTDGSP